MHPTKIFSQQVYTAAISTTFCYVFIPVRALKNSFKTASDPVSYIVYLVSRYKITELLLNNHLAQKLSATFIYLNFFYKFPENYLRPLVKRHRFCMHCMPFNGPCI